MAMDFAALEEAWRKEALLRDALRPDNVVQVCTRNLRLAFGDSEVRGVCDVRTGPIVLSGVRIVHAQGRLRLALPAGVRLVATVAEEAERIVLGDLARALGERRSAS